MIKYEIIYVGCCGRFAIPTKSYDYWLLNPMCPYCKIQHQQWDRLHSEIMADDELDALRKYNEIEM